MLLATVAVWQIVLLKNANKAFWLNSLHILITALKVACKGSEICFSSAIDKHVVHVWGAAVTWQLDPDLCDALTNKMVRERSGKKGKHLNTFWEKFRNMEKKWKKCIGRGLRWKKKPRECVRQKGKVVAVALTVSLVTSGVGYRNVCVNDPHDFYCLKQKYCPISCLAWNKMASVLA